MIKKMMSYVLGIVMVVMGFVAVFATAPQQPVYAESTENVILKVEAYATGTKTFQLQVKVTKNPGFCGLQFNLNPNQTAFRVTSVYGNDFSKLVYTGNISTGKYMWSGAYNTTATGILLRVNVELKSTVTDKNYSINATSVIGCYNDGTTDPADRSMASEPARVTVENGVLEGMEYLKEGLPAWAVILITVGGVAIVGGVTAWIVKSKKKPKTWTQVK